VISKYYGLDTRAIGKTHHAAMVVLARNNSHFGDVPRVRGPSAICDSAGGTRADNKRRE
jgi:hypothetical protein